MQTRSAAKKVSTREEAEVAPKPYPASDPMLPVVRTPLGGESGDEFVSKLRDSVEQLNSNPAASSNPTVSVETIFRAAASFFNALLPQHSLPSASVQPSAALASQPDKDPKVATIAYLKQTSVSDGISIITPRNTLAMPQRVIADTGANCILMPRNRAISLGLGSRIIDRCTMVRGVHGEQQETQGLIRDVHFVINYGVTGQVDVHLDTLIVKDTNLFDLLLGTNFLHHMHVMGCVNPAYQALCCLPEHHLKSQAQRDAQDFGTGYAVSMSLWKADDNATCAHGAVAMVTVTHSDATVTTTLPDHGTTSHLLTATHTGTYVAKLCDFGLSRCMEQFPDTVTTEQSGGHEFDAFMADLKPKTPIANHEVPVSPHCSPANSCTLALMAYERTVAELSLRHTPRTSRQVDDRLQDEYASLQECTTNTSTRTHHAPLLIPPIMTTHAGAWDVCEPFLEGAFRAYDSAPTTRLTDESDH